MSKSYSLSGGEKEKFRQFLFGFVRRQAVDGKKTSRISNDNTCMQPQLSVAKIYILGSMHSLGEKNLKFWIAKNINQPVWRV